ncbi:MAG: DUF2306 domain-containing protein [Burkholderiaceae bacterium]|jgi:uncharacterized membrane protein|nr:DUF2306 domain-containing protein [Burkholderiales bacterium]MCZ8103419.1 DUF2306 domain-containing protein [Burkholderiales bacterium]MCZ8336826.1 DUF2306 domain-containing protein [Burkholderiaceae bacterium]
MNPVQAQILQPAIAVHVIAASLALALGAWVLLARKGTPMHRLAGRAWALAMAVTAAGSFAIEAKVLSVDTPLGRFGPIHLLSAFVLYQLARAIAAIRAGDVGLHRRAMTGSFAGLAIAGIFTVLPGRTLGAWLAAAVAAVAG